MTFTRFCSEKAGKQHASLNSKACGYCGISLENSIGDIPPDSSKDLPSIAEKRTPVVSLLDSESDRKDCKNQKAPPPSLYTPTAQRQLNKMLAFYANRGDVK
jgi:hypothetical protein